MPDTTSVLSLPLIQAAQAQKHVPHNEALRVLDAIVQLSVANRTLTAPPGSPTEGDRHIVAAAATGAWVGQSGRIAVYESGLWTFYAPQTGWRAWVEAESVLLVWNGTIWTGILGAELSVDRLGISATPDATNRLSVTSPAVLLNHAGTSHEVSINKAAAGNDAAIAFKDGFSTRGMIGLLGDDNLTLKVSPDGTTFHDGLTILGATGKVRADQAVNLNPAATDLASPVDGDIWYNSTTGKFRGRQAGASVDLINAGGGGSSFPDVAFEITDDIDATKVAKFQASGITTGTTRTYTLPNTSATLAHLGTATQTFTGSIDISAATGPSLRLLSAAEDNVTFGLYDLQGIGSQNFEIVFSALTEITQHRSNSVAMLEFDNGERLKALVNLGVGGASPDATNRLSVNSPAVLLNNAGSGMDLKVNKATAGDDAALTFQTGFTTHALMGLLANNDFSLKVGPGLLTALTVNPTTGAVSFPNTTFPTLPAGVDDEVQYRNGSAMGAASLVRIGSTGNLNLVSNSGLPTAPAANRLQLHARRRAGADWLDVQHPSGRSTPVQSHLGFGRVATWTPSTSSTVITSGMPRTAVGTVSTPTLASTNLSSSMRRWRVTSAATANSVADERAAATLCWRGNAASLGGFTYSNRFNMTTLQATSVGYFGLLASTAALSTTQTIASLVNCIGIGFTNGTNTNWQLLHNDGSGAPTAVDMGASFPVSTTTNVYTLMINAAPNASSVWVRVTNEVTGAVFEQEITTNLPASTDFLSVRNFLHNGGVAAAVAYDCAGVYLETDY